MKHGQRRKAHHRRKLHNFKHAAHYLEFMRWCSSMAGWFRGA